MVCLSISEVYRVSPASLPILTVLCALDEGSSGVALRDCFYEPTNFLCGEVGLTGFGSRTRG
jgi:hypothetical protein